MSIPPRTLCEMFQRSLEERPRSVAFLRKVEGAFRQVSSREMGDRVTAVATGLRKLGLEPGERVAILSENRLEWAITDWALLHCGAVVVPVYSTLQPAAVQTILADSGAVAAFVADATQLEKLGDAACLPQLRQIFVFDGESAADDPRVHTFRELDARGVAHQDAQAFERAWRAVGPDDLASLIYTSGTSGRSKGVMLTHANIVANIISVLRRLPITDRDTCLSFLPLSHVLERTCGHFLMWHTGAVIAYAESIEAVGHNLIEVHPTVLISVPRLYEKMNARMRAAVASAPRFRQRLFAWAEAVGDERVRHEQAGKPVPAGLRLRHHVADFLVFRKLRSKLGDRIRLLISGGAPMSRPIADFFYAAGLPILEGYGLTETSPVLCVNPADRPKIGAVGPPIDDVELRIDTNGEILARGPNVMQGYWNDPKATAEAMAGGWFHTGDVGEIDGDGYLRITDRLKDLIVTAGGKKVAPQPIEARLKAFPYLAEAILFGDQRKFVSAIVIPNFPNLEAWARSHGVAFDSHTALVVARPVLLVFEEFFAKINQELAPFERIKRFRLLDRDLEHRAGEITPSMKVRRSVVATTFAELIESMYAEPPGAEVGCPATGTSSSGTVPAPEPAPAPGRSS